MQRSYSEKLRIWETNFGRESGWHVVRHGDVIAILSDPQFEEMFWDSYQINIVSTDSELRQVMQTADFWKNAENEGLLWRSCEFGELAVNAFPAITPSLKSGRLLMRGLYLSIGEPRFWDRLILWWRSYFRRQTLAQ